MIENRKICILIDGLKTTWSSLSQKTNITKSLMYVKKANEIDRSGVYENKLNISKQKLNTDKNNTNASMTTSRKYSYVAFFVIAFLLSGCSENVINRGYDVATVDFTKIQPGKDTLETVWEKFGSPTTISSVIHPNGDYCWYYSSKNMTKSGFLKPTLKNTKLWIITFDKNNTVKSVKLNNKEYKINMKHETSKSDGKTRGIGKELFGGAGRYIHKFDK